MPSRERPKRALLYPREEKEEEEQEEDEKAVEPGESAWAMAFAASRLLPWVPLRGSSCELSYAARDGQGVPPPPPPPPPPRHRRRLSSVGAAMRWWARLRRRRRSRRYSWTWRRVWQRALAPALSLPEVWSRRRGGGAARGGGGDGDGDGDEDGAAVATSGQGDRAFNAARVQESVAGVVAVWPRQATTRSSNKRRVSKGRESS